MVYDKIVSWASTCRDTLIQSLKTCPAGRKTPRYSQNLATNYDLRRNRLLGMNVSRCTETVLQNMLCDSTNLPQVHSNLCHRLRFATKSYPGQQRVDVHRNIPRKHSERVEELSRYSQNRAINYDLRQNRLLGFNVSRYTETVLENVLRRSKNPQVQLKPSYKQWFATKSSPG